MKKIIVLQLLLTSLLFAQGTKLGFRIDPAYVLVDDAGKSDNFVAPYSLSIPIIINPISYFGIELRPGITIAGEEFFGLEYGAFLRYDIPETDFSVLAGMNHLT